MKTITVEANGSPMDVTRDQINVNIYFTQRRIAAINSEKANLVRQLRKYQSDLKRFDESD